VPGRGLTLYYVRHAEVLANVSSGGLSYEQMDDFTELGTQQVEALTEYLLDAELSVDVILTSPTRRTQSTITPYLEAANMTAVMWPELAECCADDPTGAPLPTEPTYYDYFEIELESERIVLRDDGANQLFRTDTFEDGLFMVMLARDEFLRRYSQSGLTILVSGHAVAGALLLGLLRGYDMSQGLATSGPSAIYMMNTGIQKLTEDPETGEFRLDGQNINQPLR